MLVNIFGSEPRHADQPAPERERRAQSATDGHPTTVAPAHRDREQDPRRDGATVTPATTTTTATPSFNPSPCTPR